MRGGTTTACGQRCMASTMDMAERTPKGRTSYDAAVTTPRLPPPPTISGLPRRLGSSRCSTDA
ncbi:MAG: hypothetical protein IPG17_12340 [Sandaracinaceae bacterium]|nr:hypothetical protein [Sandaracinaceae bacterium]